MASQTEAAKRRLELPNVQLLESPDGKSPHRLPVTPTRELLVWRNHCVKVMLETEREKERFQKTEHEKHLKVRDQSIDSPKEKKSSTSRLAEVRTKRAREISELAARAESSAREHEAHLKQLLEQRQSECETRARSKLNRLTEVQQCRSQLLHEEDSLRTQQLEEMQRKLDRSREAHSAALQDRAQSAARKRQKAASLSPRKILQDEMSRLLSYVHKMQSASRKHTEVKLQEASQREELRRLKAQKMQQVAQNLRSQRQKVEDWARSLENRHHSVTVSRTSDHVKTDRSDLLKEREDQRAFKREKMMQVRASRQTELLWRWAEKGRRIDAMKKQRALSVERHRDRLHSDMMEKEKTYRVLQEVARSPQSRRAQQLLKDLGQTN